MSADDTIFAIATGPGRGAVTVMRISGPGCGAVLDGVCRSRPAPRRAALRRLRNAADEILDQGLVLWLPGPRSYTGEDCAELHLHGGRAVARAVADALLRLGARPAEAGEFTRRAFLNGRMDLLEAEAIADLVAADTQEQRRQALRQMEGALGALYEGWSARLRDLLAAQEALIDFPDEDLPAEAEAALAETVADLRAEIADHLQDDRRGERLRDGLVFAIVGAPNVGKSSLLNALVGSDAAIVSATPGTTRDAVEARMELGGIPVTLVDTAGLRETEDSIEAEGVRRAKARAEAADLRILVSDPGCTEMPLAVEGGPSLHVANKIDLVPAPSGVLGVSARTGEGMQALRDRLGEVARQMLDVAGPPPLTRARHRFCLQGALEELDEAATATLPELRAENLRRGMRHLGRITGAVGVEDVLDAVFSRFCIGK